MPSGVARIPEPREWLLTKTCTRCEVTKPWAKFPPRRYWPDGSVRVIASHCHDCDSALTRARHASYRRRNEQPYREYQADWQRRKRAALRAERTADTSLPVVPHFLAWLFDRSQELGGWAALGECIGVHERQLYRFRTGEQSQVRLAEVDRCAVALGFHLTDIYPEEAEMRDRILAGSAAR